MKYITYALIGIAISLVTVAVVTIYGYFFTDDIELITVGQAILWIIAGVILFVSAHYIKGEL